jgi:hypothetical protein
VCGLVPAFVFVRSDGGERDRSGASREELGQQFPSIDALNKESATPSPGAPGRPSHSARNWHRLPGPPPRGIPLTRTERLVVKQGWRMQKSGEIPSWAELAARCGISEAELTSVCQQLVLKGCFNVKDERKSISALTV